MNKNNFNYYRSSLNESSDFKIVLSSYILNSPLQFEILETLKSNDVILNNFSGSNGKFYLFEDEFLFEFNYYNHELINIAENADISKKLVLSVFHISEF